MVFAQVVTVWMECLPRYYSEVARLVTTALDSEVLALTLAPPSAGGTKGAPFLGRREPKGPVGLMAGGGLR